jgi:hypothetical protein
LAYFDYPSVSVAAGSFILSLPRLNPPVGVNSYSITFTGTMSGLVSSCAGDATICASL